MQKKLSDLNLLCPTAFTISYSLAQYQFMMNFRLIYFTLVEKSSATSHLYYHLD